MNAPVLWILTPILAGCALVLLQRFQRLVWAAGSIYAFLLALAAMFLELDSVVEIGPVSINFADSIQVLGRQFILVDQDRQALGLIFLLATFGFVMAPLARPGPLFIPIGLIAAGLVVAALSVDPFLYAALFIEIIVLISIPLLVAPGRIAGRGVLRFLTYETLGMPFILFSDWMLAGSEGSPGDSALVLRAVVLLGIGFAFLLAVFPFHSWVPMIFEEANPYVAAFVALLLLLVTSLFGIELFNRFAWLRNSQEFLPFLRAAGLIMVLVGGIWAAFSLHLGRALGFAIMCTTGLVLLALSLGLDLGLPFYFSYIRTGALALLVWSMCLYLIARGRPGMRLGELRGAGRSSPVIAAGLVLSCFTLAGYPVLAGYPEIAALFGELASQGVLAAAGAAIGLAGLLAHGLRALWALVSLEESPSVEGDPTAGRDEIPSGHRTVIVLGIALMVLVGML